MKNLPLWLRFVLFAGTVSPILVLQGIVESRSGGAIPWVLIAVGASLFFYPLALFWLTGRMPPVTREFAETRYSTPNVASFLLAYLLPILGLSYANPAELAALALLVLLIGAVYTRGGLLYVQPIFFLTGWEVYECMEKDGRWDWVLTRHEVKPGIVTARDLGNHTLVHVPEPQHAMPVVEPTNAPVAASQ